MPVSGIRGVKTTIDHKRHARMKSVKDLDSTALPAQTSFCSPIVENAVINGFPIRAV
jgi:hypothetical protein